MELAFLLLPLKDGGKNKVFPKKGVEIEKVNIIKIALLKPKYHFKIKVSKIIKKKNQSIKIKVSSLTKVSKSKYQTQMIIKVSLYNQSIKNE